MPRPTLVIPFGEEVNSEDSVFSVVDLDPQSNLDQYGNVLSEFLDSEDVYILLHLQPGHSVQDVQSSYGSIANPSSPVIVTRTVTIEEVVFANPEDGYTIPHYSNGMPSFSFEGKSATPSMNDRTITMSSWPVICSISYNYDAFQYRLSVPSLNIAVGEDFPIRVEFELE